MTFLKKLGQIIVTGLEIVAGFLPVVSAAVPGSSGIVTTISADVAQLLNIIVGVEAAGTSLGLPGPDKLRMAAPQILQVLLQSAALAGKPIADPAKALEAAGVIGGGLADLLNAIHPDAAVATPMIQNPTPAQAAAIAAPSAAAPAAPTA